jgi:hypothetical protein
MLNLTTKVAYGIASLTHARMTYLVAKIVVSYSIVSIDHICDRYEELELDIRVIDNET